MTLTIHYMMSIAFYVCTMITIVEEDDNGNGTANQNVITNNMANHGVTNIANNVAIGAVGDDPEVSVDECDGCSVATQSDSEFSDLELGHATLQMETASNNMGAVHINGLSAATDSNGI
jgi:hypothetical protein